MVSVPGMLEEVVEREGAASLEHWDGQLGSARIPHLKGASLNIRNLGDPLGAVILMALGKTR